MNDGDALKTGSPSDGAPRRSKEQGKGAPKLPVDPKALKEGEDEFERGRRLRNQSAKLLLCVKKDDLAGAMKALDRGADPNFKNGDGSTALLSSIGGKPSCAGRGLMPLVDRLLATEGVELNPVNCRDKHTPLTRAANFGDWALAMRLAAIPEVKVNWNGRHGISALGYAIGSKHPGLCEALLARADLVPKDGEHAQALAIVEAAALSREAQRPAEDASSAGPRL